MDFITVIVLAVLIFMFSVAVTAFFFKSAVDVHNKTMEAVLDNNMSFRKNPLYEDPKKEEDHK
jgi:hypothetical protein